MCIKGFYSIFVVVVVVVAGWSDSSSYIRVTHTKGQQIDTVNVCVCVFSVQYGRVHECITVKVCVSVCVCIWRCLPYVKARTIWLSVDKSLDSVYGHEEQ